MLVIGIGNAFARDEGIGLRVAEAFLGKPGLTVRSHGGEGAELMQLWQGHDAAVVVIACSSGREPGTVQCFDVGADGLPPAYVDFVANHTVGLPEAIELSKTLNSLPARFVIVAVEGEDYGQGVGLSPAVEAACAAAVQQVTDQLIAWGFSGLAGAR